MSYETPNEFVMFLKEARRQPFSPGVRQSDFDEITKQDLQKHGLAFEYGDKGTENLDRIVLSLFNDIVAAQPEESRTQITSSVGAGVVEAGRVNAFIARGRRSCHAVIVNSGLMVLLNKAIKLWIGGSREGGLVYCNRKPFNEITIVDIQEMLEELFDVYRSTGVPRGPMVKVSEECMGIYSLTLHIAEAFVISHELGHFLNGDLDTGSGVAILPWCEEVEYYKGDSNHEKEHNADITGYEILRNYVRRKYEGIDDDFIMMGVVAIMDVVGAISKGGSNTHPDAKERVIRIAHHFFGEEVASKWRTSYDSKAAE